MSRLSALVILGSFIWCSNPVSAQPPAPPVTGQQQPPQPPAKPEEEEEEQPPVYVEQVVVSASKVEQQLINAPATVSVVTTDMITSTPATNYAELLRSVPGVNIAQTSAREIAELAAADLRQPDVDGTFTIGEERNEASVTRDRRGELAPFEIREVHEARAGNRIR